MVLLPSLAKILPSELVVELWPTPRGFCVVPSKYSVALFQHYQYSGSCKHQQEQNHSHFVIKRYIRRVKVHVSRGILRIITRWDNIRESDILDSTEGMSTRYETNHFFLGKSLLRESGNMSLEVFLRLRDTWRTSFNCISSATPEVNFRVTATYQGYVR